MIISYLRGLSALSPPIIRYLAAVAMVGFAIDGGVYSVLLNLYLVRLGFGPEQVGLVNSAGTLAFAITSLPAGILGERLGSRAAMLIGLGLMAGASALLPLADLLAAGAQLPWLLVQIAVLYLGLALFFVNTAPFVLEHVRGDQRTQLLSVQSALLSLAAFGGSLAGGFLPPLAAALSGATLAEPGPYRYGLLSAGIGLLVATVALRPKAPVAQAQSAPPLTAGAAMSGAGPILGLLGLIALVRMLQIAGLAATTTFFNVYLDAELAVPTAQIGVIIALGRLLGVPAALATSALTGRFGKPAVVIGSSLGTAVGLLPLALIPQLGAAGLGFVTIISLSWVRYAASLVYFLELVPPARRALVAGVIEMAAGVCFTALAFGGGYVVAFFGYRTLFLISAALTALSALVFWLAFRRRGPAAEG